jgi:membrane associated rhomboid family serine protease
MVCVINNDLLYVFFVMQLSVLVAGSANTRVGEVLQAALVFDPRRRGEVWRFVSYMLLHAGAAHAALNLGIQLLLAAPLECEQGRRRTALIYLGGGLAGQ